MQSFSLSVPLLILFTVFSVHRAFNFVYFFHFLINAILVIVATFFFVFISVLIGYPN